ncbi:MAG: hypothetical protein JOZ69_06220, partial [Myxococcales bacterium]|nr:hypothetical protein [Myxococcales bacterium]
GPDLGVMYARLPGDVWSLGGGFAVARAKVSLGGPFGFLSNADDKDKASVPWLLLVTVVLIATALGLGLTVLEHNLPLGELVKQSDRLKVGAVDRLHVAEFRGRYRLVAQSINEGIERAIEKSGGVTRKPADLESILGPTPAQPAMSAFSFPMAGENSQHAAPVAPTPAAFSPPTPPLGSYTGVNAAAATLGLTPAGGAPVPAAPGGPPPSTPRAPGPPAAARPAPPPPPPPSAPRPPVSSNAAAGAGAGPASAGGSRSAPPPLSAARVSNHGEEEDATTVAAVPAEVMAQAGGTAGANSDENADWLVVYHDFIRIKRQCGEPTEGLTFEKFSQTLRKNRDVLVDRHGCKRIKFSVYVKEGRASLKATPLKD